jgi:hypothetical protein
MATFFAGDSVFPGQSVTVSHSGVLSVCSVEAFPQKLRSYSAISVISAWGPAVLLWPAGEGVALRLNILSGGDLFRVYFALP